MAATADAGRDAPRIFVLGSFVAACSAKVERLPRPGESLSAQAFTLEAGGKGFNLAVGAKRLGAAVDGVLAIGDDFFSHLAAPALEQAGLPLRMLRVHKGATGSGVGFTDATGENCLAVYSGANRLLGAADIRPARGAITSARLVLAQFEIGDEPIVEAFRLARQAGALTLLNPSPYRDVAAEILAQTSVLVLNRVEALQMGASLGLARAGNGAAIGLDVLQAFGDQYSAQRLRVRPHRAQKDVHDRLRHDGGLRLRLFRPHRHRLVGTDLHCDDAVAHPA